MDGKSPLNYSPPLPAHRRAKVRRWVVATALVVGVGLAIWRGPGLWRDVQAEYWWRQCARYENRADVVVYDEDPRRAPALLKAGKGFTMLPPHVWQSVAATTAPVGRVPPACLTSLKPLTSGMSWADSAPIVFLHGMRTPDGHPVLVCVAYDPWQGCFISYAGGDRGYSTLGGGDILGRGFVMDVARLPPLRLYEGQPDPTDPTRFSFRFDLGETSGTVDGRVDETRSVRLQLRPSATTRE
ncbi:MAG TPA: hypothetical protein VF796_15865 [Humisphaera sp.]